MWVKICGNTSLADARLAAEAGVDALGFVFAPSKRQVTAEQVAAIVPALPAGPLKIGVFGTHSFDEIRYTVRAAGLNGAQLHDFQDAHGLRLAQSLRREFGGEFLLIQTLHWKVDGDPAGAEEELRTRWRSVVHENLVDAVLFDTKFGAAQGGTGKSFDWARARAVLAREEAGPRIILAGGLNPGNVGQATSVLEPWGVDVVSGTEAAPGKKDPDKVRSFIAAARAAGLAKEQARNQAQDHKPAADFIRRG
jgi:phosphoribosylanthranilate isomerase